jgi:predicted lipoprotein with Yx(FWY)xxD motif
MRKSGWTVATGLSSLALLLTACGGSSSSTTSTTGAASDAATQSTASSAASTGSSSSSAASSSPASSANAETKSPSAVPRDTDSADAQPSSGQVSFPPVGTTVLIVQHSNLGWVMAKADGHVVYSYAKDRKGGAPTCTGSCASVWAPVTGMPKAGPADNFPGTFGLVTGAGGKKVITYNGYPLYTYVGAPVLSTKGNGIGGVWHVITLSESDISGA